MLSISSLEERVLLGFSGQAPAENEARITQADRAAFSIGMSFDKWVAQSAILALPDFVI